jgi:hypothetical protein
MEFLDLFRKTVSSSISTKLNEMIQFLFRFSYKTLRILFYTTLI